MDSLNQSSADPLLQVCVIPFRVREGQLEYCVITSLKKRRWIFPKGIIDPGETPVESALKEAYEEAGLRGEIVGKPCGRFLDSKWERRIVVSVLTMRVSECEDEYPEAKRRQRRWLPAEQTQRLLHRTELRKFLRIAHQRLSHDSSDHQSIP